MKKTVDLKERNSNVLVPDWSLLGLWIAGLFFGAGIMAFLPAPITPWYESVVAVSLGLAMILMVGDGIKRAMRSGPPSDLDRKSKDEKREIRNRKRREAYALAKKKSR